MEIFAVSTAKGPRWDETRGIREQPGWTEHADHADALAARGTILLGGPIAGDDPADVALLAVRAEDEAHVHALFADDPWLEAGVLDIKQVRAWTIWLGLPE